VAGAQVHLQRSGRAILASADFPFAASRPLFALEQILARLAGGPAEAYEATFHLGALSSRCDADGGVSEKSPAHGHLSLCGWDDIVAGNGLALIIANGLAKGGLLAARACGCLGALVRRKEGSEAFVAAGGLPPLVFAIALPDWRAELAAVFSFRAAADAATRILHRVASNPQLRQAIVEAGAVPALVG